MLKIVGVSKFICDFASGWNLPKRVENRSFNIENDRLCYSCKGIIGEYLIGKIL